MKAASNKKSTNSLHNALDSKSIFKRSETPPYDSRLSVDTPMSDSSASPPKKITLEQWGTSERSISCEFGISKQSKNVSQKVEKGENKEALVVDTILTSSIDIEGDGDSWYEYTHKISESILKLQ